MDLDKYGVPGVIAMILIAAIIWCAKFIKDIIAEHKQEREDLERTHRSEREEWRRSIDKQFDESNRNNQRQAEEYVKATKEHTNILSELTTILKSKK